MDSNQTIPSGAGEELPAPPGAGPGPLMKGKLALVAGAVGLVAVGGIGGFVLGQSSSATAGTASDTGRFGGGPPGTGGGEGFSGQLPGGGVAGGPGTSSGSGADPTT